MSDFQEPTPQEYEEVRRHSRELNETETRIARATYEDERFVFELKGSALNGTVLSLPARALVPVENATNEQLGAFIVTVSGSSIRWPELDFGIGAPALAMAACGLTARSVAARAMGSATSEAKAAAVRANGAKGGRPRKNPVPA